MSINVLGFQSFFIFLPNFVLANLATSSIRVKMHYVLANLATSSIRVKMH